MKKIKHAPTLMTSTEALYNVTRPSSKVRHAKAAVHGACSGVIRLQGLDEDLQGLFPK